MKYTVLSVVFEGMIWQEKCSRCGTLHNADEMDMDTQTGEFFCIPCLEEMFKKGSKFLRLTNAIGYYLLPITRLFD